MEEARQDEISVGEQGWRGVGLAGRLGPGRLTDFHLLLALNAVQWAALLNSSTMSNNKAYNCIKLTV